MLKHEDRGVKSAGEERALVARELDRLAGELETMGAQLCLDRELPDSSLVALQTIDLVAQQQRCLAILLRARDFDRAIAQCTLAALTERLTAA